MSWWDLGEVVLLVWLILLISSLTRKVDVIAHFLKSQIELAKTKEAQDAQEKKAWEEKKSRKKTR